jgi:hypothetical protein
MKIVKAKFLRNGEPSGREYSYLLPEGMELAVGDYALLRKDGVGIITAVDVDKSEVGCPLDKLKELLGKYEPEK